MFLFRTNGNVVNIKNNTSFLIVINRRFMLMAIRMKRLFYMSQDSWSEVTNDGFVSGVVRTSVERGERRT